MPDPLAKLLRQSGRGVAIREKTLGSNHLDTAASLNSLALLLADQGDLAGARPLYERALAISEEALGPILETPQRSSITSPTYFGTKATSRVRGRFSSVR